MNKINSGIYLGSVIHERQRPRFHRLKYNVFSLLLDLDEFSDAPGKYKFLAYNRRALFSVRDEDHGDTKGIRKWVEERLRLAGLEIAADRIMILCYPRILGYVFNPLTVYFCYGPDGELRAIIYEVHNTFRERHSYVLPVEPDMEGIIKQRCSKEFYVSPFVPMECTYEFRIKPPGKEVSVVIREDDDDGLLLAATFSGRHIPLTDINLFKAAICYPLMTIKVIIGIHIEALRLFFKGAPYFRHPGTSNQANSNLKQGSKSSLQKQ